MEIYIPNFLKLPFPEIRRIYVGDCGGDYNHYAKLPYMGGHTHKCPWDSDYNSVCLGDGSKIFNSDDTITDLMWHEYGHVRHDRSNKVVKCGKDNLNHLMADPQEWESGTHGPDWQAIMVSLGKPHIKGSYVKEPY